MSQHSISRCETPAASADTARETRRLQRARCELPNLEPLNCRLRIKAESSAVMGMGERVRIRMSVRGGHGQSCWGTKGMANPCAQQSLPLSYLAAVRLIAPGRAPAPPAGGAAGGTAPRQPRHRSRPRSIPAPLHPRLRPAAHGLLRAAPRVSAGRLPGRGNSGCPGGKCRKGPGHLPGRRGSGEGGCGEGSGERGLCLAPPGRAGLGPGANGVTKGSAGSGG